jgi:peptide/nickel transport system substrate-binding protein
MRIRKLVYLILAVVLVVTAVGVMPATAQDTTLIMARAVDSTGLDPHTQTAFQSLRLLSLIYEPLVRADENLAIVPALAESWEFNDDATQLTFSLRAGVTFHDGSDFTAADVIASYERILDEETGSATRSNLLSIESMDAPDDLTVVLNLNTADVPLLTALSSQNTVILSSDVIESGDPTTDAIGTGPFVLDEWAQDQQTLLSANENWWGEGPNISGIELRISPDEATIMAALRAGEIDFAPLDDPLIATLPTEGSDVIVERAGDIAYHALQLRASEVPLDILEVRQAISCAINRQEVVDAAALGEGRVTGPLTQPAWAAPVDELFCYEQDVDRARELMESAGMADGFDLTIMAANAEPPTALTEAQTIQSQLAEININVEIEPLELGVYVDRWLAGDFAAAIALNGGRVDPYPMYSRYWQNEAQFQNTAGYIDDTLDDLMRRGQAETDVAARLEIFNEFERHLAEQAPWIWLYTGFVYSAHQPYVEGWVPDPNGYWTGLSQITLAR